MLTSVRSLLAATILAGCAFAATPALADDAAPADPTPEFTVTGNVALVTDYRFRGVSQSAGDPAIQGGLTLNHKSGLYVGAWSSSINFANVGADATFGNQELDLFGGWTGSLTNNLTLDAGLLYYAYPGGHVGKAEFFEPYASLSTTVGPAKLKVGANYAWKGQSGLAGNDSLYLRGDVTVAIPNTPVSVLAHVGRTDGQLGILAPRSKYTDWSLGAEAAYKFAKVGIQYVDTDITNNLGYAKAIGANGGVLGYLTLSF